MMVLQSRSTTPGRKRSYVDQLRRKTVAVYDDRLQQSYTMLYDVLRPSLTMTVKIRRVRLPWHYDRCKRRSNNIVRCVNVNGKRCDVRSSFFIVCVRKQPLTLTTHSH